MKALIIDDEGKAREVLHLMLKVHAPRIKEVREADSGISANRILKNYEPELVFLDIKMPGMDGFQWLRQVEHRHFTVVFCTAYDQYAIRAIRYSAFDYLLKPVDPEDLVTSLERYFDNKSNASYENLFYNTAQKRLEEFKLTINTQEGRHYIPANEIVRLEADGNYTRFFLLNKEKFIASKSMGYFADLLPSDTFLRCHKSHLVNRNQIQSLQHDNIHLSEDHIVKVSRRKLPRIKKLLG